MANSKSILGILGGMGPEATNFLFSKIIEQTNARTDQDHIEIFVHNNTKIPDRTEAILRDGEDPMREMLRSAKLLESMGADFIAIPCMTAHYYIDGIQKEIRPTIINGIQETGRYIRRKHTNVEKVGILSTTGTAKTGLFQQALKAVGLAYCIPDEDTQEKFVMEAIYGNDGIKAGSKSDRVVSLLSRAAQMLHDSGAQVVITGCTEIPLALKQNHVSIPLIDPMTVITEVAIEFCSTTTRKRK